MGCGNSKSCSSPKSNNKVHGHYSSTTNYGYLYPSSTQAYYDPSTRQRTAFRNDDNNNSTRRRVMYNSEEQNDDTFDEYIQRAGQKIRTGDDYGSSNIIIDPEFISNTTSTDEPADYLANDNYDQQFSDFIQIAKKKLRTTSRVGKNGSFRRG
ncbi:hypothetical protein PIB30_000980 [Stylosanthes scabra]|uniref:Uncharacterized protein n=1 Tax=Stylosanthes scabra TaxID=79078 RepID=A0ABU6S250_9FABA|nr:hypothetical protein [Stylosanthes scabra]